MVASNSTTITSKAALIQRGMLMAQASSIREEGSRKSDTHRGYFAAAR
jgi:hypothetical protein